MRPRRWPPSSAPKRRCAGKADKLEQAEALEELVRMTEQIKIIQKIRNTRA